MLLFRCCLLTIHSLYRESFFTPTDFSNILLLSDRPYPYTASSEIDLAKAVASASDTLEIAFSLDPSLTLNSSFACELSIDRALVLALARAIDISRTNTCDVGIKSFIIFVRSLAPELDIKPKRSPLDNHYDYSNINYPIPIKTQQNSKSGGKLMVGLGLSN
jgi:hypothetical protein